MTPHLNTILSIRYKSLSQKIRILSEAWVGSDIYCPSCGSDIHRCKNNQPVADFICSSCTEEYELKSKGNAVGGKIVDGAYRTMIERLNCRNNPSLFVLNYHPASYDVMNFLVIPKHFFIPKIIEKRKPLTLTARRAGWIGCNILFNQIPQSGKIYFIRNKNIQPKEKVLLDWKKTLFLRDEKEAAAKGWLLDTMRCVENINKPSFSLNDIYAFEKELKLLHPNNRHIKDKLRQQLQILRNRGYLDFVSRGFYRLT